MKKIRMITVDAQDGLGKTTLINNLKKLFANRPIHSTRLLGGSGEDDFQLALRKVLLHPKFPINSVELEEQLFALTDVEGIREAGRFLASTPGGIVLKDRALASHVCYALAKFMTVHQIERCHEQVIYEEKKLSKEYGSLNIILAATETDFVIDRIRKRAALTGEPIVERLENEQVQWSVMNAMRSFPDHVLAQGLEYRLLEVAPQDSIQDVFAKAKAILDNYEIG